MLGGGITGAGIARDAALRGLSVGLIDKGDFAAGTSSKSSKLIHGGLRYLKQAELRLVFEATAERALLLRLAPHLVRPLEFLMPAYRRSFYWMVSAGLTLYDLLALYRPPSGHRSYNPQQAKRLEPGLRQADLVGALVYSDCATQDARLALENILDASSHGALCANYVMATEPIRYQGRTSGVMAVDVQTGERFPIQARVVVSALGPWSDTMLQRFGSHDESPLLRTTKGVHIIVDGARLPVRRAVTMPARDGRVIFCIPSGERTIVGTTDTDDPGDADRTAATFEDVVYLLAAANFYFPDAKLRIEDVISTYAGLRPLVAARGSASSLSREHEVLLCRDGLIAIVGGKLTTYRRMAREVVDRALGRLLDMGFGEQARPCTTGERPLPRAFARGVTAQDEAQRIASTHRIELPCATHLAQTYGNAAERVLEAGPRTRIDPELPFLWCEIAYALRYELAVTVSDLLWRRVPLALFARDQGLSVVAAVADQVAAHTGMPIGAQIEEFYGQVARSRAYRKKKQPSSRAPANSVPKKK